MDKDMKRQKRIEDRHDRDAQRAEELSDIVSTDDVSSLSDAELSRYLNYWRNEYINTRRDEFPERVESALDRVDEGKAELEERRSELPDQYVRVESGPAGELTFVNPAGNTIPMNLEGGNLVMGNGAKILLSDEAAGRVQCALDLGEGVVELTKSGGDIVGSE